MDLVDTHCHIHFQKYPLNPDETIEAARNVGVNRMICVGTTIEDSRRAIKFVAGRQNIWATAGVHPHDASGFISGASQQESFKKILDMSSICAIGEIGLDYFKNYSPKTDQQKALRLQIEAGLDSGLPYIFHIRDAWEDFWQIFDSYPNLRGVVHSFSAHRQQLDQILTRGLLVGLNGIMTFTSDKNQLAAAKAVPLDKLVLETDAPFLAPKPERGKTCEPRHIAVINEFLAGLRDESAARIAGVTTANAVELFNL